MQPTITTIIAAYNAAATIQKAVASALVEPEVVEVIVVDDASTDDTVARAETANDGSGRLKILHQQHNAGPSAARNRAIRESSGFWISVLDADDYFLPGRMKGLLEYAGDADFIADDLWQVTEAAPNTRKSLLGITLVRTITLEEFVRSNISDPKRQRGEMGFLKPLMRRGFLTSNNLQYQEQMRLGEDYEFYARALAAGARFTLIPPQGYISVIRPHSLSGLHTENDLLNLRNCDRELQKLPRLTLTEKEALRQHYLNTDCRLQWRLLINAVKEKNLRAALSTFCNPPPVPFYLMGQLSEQLVLRTAKRFGRAA